LGEEEGDDTAAPGARV